MDEKQQGHNDQDAESGDGRGIIAPGLAMRPDGQAGDKRNNHEKSQNIKGAHYPLLESRL